MCLLTYLPAGIQPDTDALHNGALINDDGHGFAIVRLGKEIIVRRGLDARHMIEMFRDMRARYPDGPAMFHSRMATHGAMGKLNVHPFLLGGQDRRTVLAHNGILPQPVQPDKGDDRSDTRIMAEDVLPLWPFQELDHRSTRRALGRWVGRFNKILILTIDPSMRRNVYLINGREGIWDNGSWYSNDGYLPWVASYSLKPFTRADGLKYYVQGGTLHSGVEGATGGVFSDRESLDAWLANRAPLNGSSDPVPSKVDCEVCLSKRVVPRETMVCEYCLSCQDCLESTEDCLCWVPAALDRARKAT